MKRHFEKELESLKTSIIKLGSIVEEAIGLSIRSLLEQNVEISQKVIQNDERINSLEIEIDNSIVDLLALQQPVAVDLRTILAAQKINNDLERIGDHAVNIAESAITLAKAHLSKPLLELPKMAKMTQIMLRNALDSFIHHDHTLAQKVLEQEDAIDILNRSNVKGVIGLMKRDPKTIEDGLELIRISRNLERVADLTTNIAEEVIFLTRAQVVKHHGGNPGNQRV